MAWNIGANDLANSMASSVGAKAVSLRNAVILGGILAFIGAVFVGSHVAGTIKSGIVSPSDIKEEVYVMYGAIAALLGASFWITGKTRALSSSADKGSEKGRVDSPPISMISAPSS